MRIEGSKKCYKNSEEADKLSNVVMEMTGINKSSSDHFMYLVYLAIMHNISCEALDSDAKLRDIDIELPYIGCLSIHIDTDGSISVRDFRPENEFRNAIINAIRDGSSPLIDAANERLVKVINERFNSLV